MNGTLLEQAIFIDTSAVIALQDPDDQFHQAAQNFFRLTTDVVWASLNATTHETYTRLRYDLGFDSAFRIFDWLSKKEILCTSFDAEDEQKAREHLEFLKDHKLSFHDALLAAAMKRLGVYRVFAFDYHFWHLGFEVLPGSTR